MNNEKVCFHYFHSSVHWYAAHISGVFDLNMTCVLCLSRSNPSVQSGHSPRVHLPHLRTGWGETFCLHCGKETREPGKYCCPTEVFVCVGAEFRFLLFCSCSSHVSLFFFYFNRVKCVSGENSLSHLVRRRIVLLYNVCFCVYWL